MARYRIEGSVVDTERATHSYESEAREGGYGHVTTTLHRSRKGRWYVEHVMSWSEDGRTLDYAEWVSPEEAARMLLEQGDGDDEDEVVECHPDLAEAIAAVAE